MRLFQKPLGFIALSALLFACVPQRKFEDMEGKYQTCQEELSGLKRANQSLETDNTELSSKIEDLANKLGFLKKDTLRLGRDYRNLDENYQNLTRTYKELLDLQDQMQRGTADEMRKMRLKINDTQSDLVGKQDELTALADSLAAKSKTLENSQIELEELRGELEQRELRVRELEDILHRKDSVVGALKDKVADALYGFRDQGLSVELKNGKVYVSLENQLLFKSGSYTVDSKGKSAIKKLSGVLAKNDDISIVVEGHTDTDKYSGSGQLKDNWDLSVIRATQIVKLLIEYGKLDPKRVAASGRGEYFPLDAADTPEAKKKNRRIEIILTPKLDELFEILNAN
ncbi:OmpA family protein [Flavobacteriales bacterium]|nr:OmpA family protein [Flavobacteriales bacterium]